MIRFTSNTVITTAVSSYDDVTVTVFVQTQRVQENHLLQQMKIQSTELRLRIFYNIIKRSGLGFLTTLRKLVAKRGIGRLFGFDNIFKTN